VLQKILGPKKENYQQAGEITIIRGSLMRVTRQILLQRKDNRQNEICGAHGRNGGE
jgi:hypothetical protein